VACGRGIYPAAYAIVSDSGDTYCDNCYHERFTTCNRCGAEVRREDSYLVNHLYVYCANCYRTQHTTCAHCGREISWNDAIPDDEGHAYCLDCHRQLFVTCEACGADVPVEYAHEQDGYWYCEDCFHEHFAHCDRCDWEYPVEQVALVVVRGMDGCTQETNLCVWCRERHCRYVPEENVWIER